MRRGHDNSWLEDDNKQMIGINLGADYCAEHEWGIKDLYQILGVSNDNSVMGIERYRVREPQMDKIVIIEENKNNAALISVQYDCDLKYLYDKKLDKIFNGELNIYGDGELGTAWDGATFGIRVKRPVNIKRIKRIYDTIKNKDAAVWLGGGGVFKNGGLVIGIISAIPEHLKQQMHDTHVDTKKLQDASDATGIKAKIDAVNEEYAKINPGYPWRVPCGYHALSPSWKRDDKKTVYPVVYWLDPREQEKNNWGWFTVEELEQWIEGKGPITEKVNKE